MVKTGSWTGLSEERSCWASPRSILPTKSRISSTERTPSSEAGVAANRCEEAQDSANKHKKKERRRGEGQEKPTLPFCRAKSSVGGLLRLMCRRRIICRNLVSLQVCVPCHGREEEEEEEEEEQRERFMVGGACLLSFFSCDASSCCVESIFMGVGFSAILVRLDVMCEKSKGGQKHNKNSRGGWRQREST